jgi:hypothetical protein
VVFRAGIEQPPPAQLVGPSTGSGSGEAGGEKKTAPEPDRFRPAQEAFRTRQLSGSPTPPSIRTQEATGSASPASGPEQPSSSPRRDRRSMRRRSSGSGGEPA